LSNFNFEIQLFFRKMLQPLERPLPGNFTFEPEPVEEFLKKQAKLLLNMEIAFLFICTWRRKNLGTLVLEPEHICHSSEMQGRCGHNGYLRPHGQNKHSYASFFLSLFRLGEEENILSHFYSA
jgi:hypothetical protein